MLGILLIGIGVGLAGNKVSPRGLPLSPQPKPTNTVGTLIPLERARQFWYLGTAFFLDAREPADFTAGHIGNALNLPAQSFGERFGDIAPMLAMDSTLILYCNGSDCDLSHRLAGSLLQQGYTNLLILSNGWSAWLTAGLPTTKEVKK
jgi:rhodanese-related sulfurtransferase